MKKILVGIGVFVLVILMVILSLRTREKGKKVEAEIVKTGSITSTVKAEGVIRAKNQVKIGADVMGRILKIFVQEGDTVDKGDTLCIIDPSTWLARVKQARSRLMQDLAQLERAESDYKRTLSLFKDSLASQSQLDQVRSAYLAMKAQVSVDSSLLDESLSSYSKTIITSPIHGVVLGVHKEVGEMVVVGTINTPGSVIMDIADLSKLEVEANVDETEVVKIKPGQKTKIQVDAYPDTSFTGIVQRISGIPTGATPLSQETQGVSYPILIEIQGRPDLLPGMTATCEIITGEKDSVTVVPFTAIGKKEIKGKLKDIVFVIRGDRAKMIPVKLGLTGLKYAEVVEGVQPGDTIAVGPHEVLRKLEDGERVMLTWKTGGAG